MLRLWPYLGARMDKTRPLLESFSSRESRSGQEVRAPNHSAASASSASSVSIRPERIRIMRSQRPASVKSCVTSTKVAPRSRLRRNIGVDDASAGALVEVAGRLVGDKDGGFWRERPRQGHALLLATG